MTKAKVTLMGDVAIVPRDLYLNHFREIQNAVQFLEDTEGVGDDAFQAHILLGMVYLLCRTFAPLQSFQVDD